MTAQMINGTDAVRMWSQHDSDISTEDGRKKIASIREVYQVVTEAGDGQFAVLAAVDLPEINQVYGGTIQIRCKKRRPRQVSPIFWHVDVIWEGEFGPGGAQDSPLNDPPEVSWTKVPSQQPTDEDANNEAIVTPNGEGIEGIMVEISDLLLTIKRNYIGINLAATHAYLHSVNSDVFAGFAPGTGRLVAFDADEVVAEEVPGGGYWEVTAGIQFRYPYRTTPDKAWWARVRNEGYYVRRLIDNKVVRAFDPGNKEPVSRPVLLDEDGYALAIPDPPAQPEAVWLEWELYKPLPYGSLGLLS